MDWNDTQTEKPSHLFTRYDWPYGVIQEFSPVALYIDQFITPIWYVVGLFTNPVSAFIWLSRRIRRNNSSAIYLGALSIADLVFLVLHLIFELHSAWGINTYQYYGMCEFFNFLYIIPQYITPLIVLCFTVERWIAVCKPFYKERYCTVRRAIYVVFGVVCLCSACGLVQIYLWTFNEHFNTCKDRQPDTAINFSTIYVMGSETLMFFIVPICVLIFNILVIIEIRKISKANAIQIPQQGPLSSYNAASTITLLSVSFYLIVTTLPVTLVYTVNYIVNVGELIITDDQLRADPTWSTFFLYLTIRKLIEELCFSHYACYFFVYWLTGTQFRKEVMALLPVKFCQALINKKQGRYSIETRNKQVTNESCTTHV